VAAKGAMLDLKLDLYDASGAKVLSVDTASLGESIEMTLDGGAYRLVISSAGGYGDVGQYSISGTIVPVTGQPPVEPEPVTEAPAAPIDVVAKATSPARVALSWTASDTATAYVIERSADGIDGWVAIATVTATSFGDTTVAPGSTWHYRVIAINAIGPSAASAVAFATTPLSLPPAAPTNLVAKAVSRSSIVLTWDDESDDEAGFIVEISLDGKNWKAIGAVGAGSTAARVYGLLRNHVYRFRVRAINDAGETSDASNAATDRTFAGFWRWGSALPAKRPVRVLPIRPRTMR
jgi:predicted phage tail protein